jgi:hypothetical protein
MAAYKTHVAAAWYELTGLRFKGRIHGHERYGKVCTPYGVFRYGAWWNYIRFYELESEPPQCPLVPDMDDVTDETPEGNLVFVSSQLPYRMPHGYKSMECVDGIRYATRKNGMCVLMGNQ